MTSVPINSRSRSRSRSQALALPDRLVPALGAVAVLLTALYITLVITTIFFAAWQTQLARGIDDSRVAIQRLEGRYYAAITAIDATDPSSLGLVTPAHVEYVAASGVPGLTFAR